MPTYRASSERVRGRLIRVHPGDGGLGSPYVGACVAVPRWGVLWWRWFARRPLAEVKGLVGAGLSLREFAVANRAVEGELRRLGYRRMRYDRVRADGMVVRHEKSL